MAETSVSGMDQIPVKQQKRLIDIDTTHELQGF